MADTQSSNSNKLVPVGGQKTGRTASVLPGKFRQQTGLVRNLTRLTIGLTIQALETVADQLQEAEQETLLQRTPEPAPQDEIVVEIVKGKPVVSSPGRRPPPSPLFPDDLSVAHQLYALFQPRADHCHRPGVLVYG